MKIINLYKYQREGGGVTVSPVKPDGEYTEMVRLVADDGKMLTIDGNDLHSVVDTNSSDGWYEVDNPDSSEDTEADYQAALRDMGVDV